MLFTMQVGIKVPEKIAVPSVRNDAAFLFSVVGKWGGRLGGTGRFTLRYSTFQRGGKRRKDSRPRTGVGR